MRQPMLVALALAAAAFVVEPTHGRCGPRRCRATAVLCAADEPQKGSLEAELRREAAAKLGAPIGSYLSPEFEAKSRQNADLVAQALADARLAPQGPKFQHCKRPTPST